MLARRTRGRCHRNQAVLDYLHTQGYTEAFNALKAQTGLDYVDDGKQKYSGVLEKKWTSVLRLQKKVRRGPERELRIPVIPTRRPTSLVVPVARHRR